MFPKFLKLWFLKSSDAVMPRPAYGFFECSLSHRGWFFFFARNFFRRCCLLLMCSVKEIEFCVVPRAEPGFENRRD